MVQIIGSAVDYESSYLPWDPKNLFVFRQEGHESLQARVFP